MSVSKPASAGPSSSKAASSSTFTAPRVEPEDDGGAGMEGWEELNRKKWRGLGLSDPIKTVEVRPFYDLKLPS